MKTVLFLALIILAAQMAWGSGIKRVEINGNTYSNITKVYVNGGGRVIILFDGGGTSASVDKVPADFLASWNIDTQAQADAKTVAAAATEARLAQAIHDGFFREVDGVVYDIRQPASGWVTYRGVRVLGISGDGGLIDPAPDDNHSATIIYVKHLPPAVGDTDYLDVSVRQTGTFTFLNSANESRTVRAYDEGRICERTDIPEAVLTGVKAFARVDIPSDSPTDIIATLPDSHDLRVSGSGFFVSADGYLITNNHVVQNAHQVKIKTSNGILPATVVRTNPDEDLALLKVDGHFQPLAISSADAQLGDAVFTIGFPDIILQGTQPKYTDGKISSMAGIKDDPTQYQISVPVQPGNSGGPLVDMNGVVRGVVVARLDDLAAIHYMGGIPQNVNYAIKSQLLRDFLAQGSEVKPAIALSETESSGVIPRVQQSVAIVLVY